jgi:hypothetical protein
MKVIASRISPAILAVITTQPIAKRNYLKAFKAAFAAFISLAFKNCSIF